MIFEHGEVWQISSGKKKPANRGTQYRKLRAQVLNNLKGQYREMVFLA
jgi:hypothetical protein